MSQDPDVLPDNINARIFAIGEEIARLCESNTEMIAAARGAWHCLRPYCGQEYEMWIDKLMVAVAKAEELAHD